MDGKAERRWLDASPCDNERTIAFRTNALRVCEGKSSELIRPGPGSRVGTEYSFFDKKIKVVVSALLASIRYVCSVSRMYMFDFSFVFS